jgi:hypothetical protein
MEQPLKYRDLIRILRRFGVHEETFRGKGSERMLVGMVDGRTERYPTKCHNEGDVKPQGVIKAIRRRFKLTKQDGISDGEFYSH